MSDATIEYIRDMALIALLCWAWIVAFSRGVAAFRDDDKGDKR